MNSVTKCYTTKVFLLVYFTNATHVISYSEKTNTVIESWTPLYQLRTLIWTSKFWKLKRNLFYKSQLAGGWRVSFLQSLLELNLGPPNKNPSSCTKKNLNPGYQDCKSNGTLHCKTKWKRNTNREKRSSWVWLSYNIVIWQCHAEQLLNIFLKSKVSETNISKIKKIWFENNN